MFLLRQRIVALWASIAMMPSLPPWSPAFIPTLLSLRACAQDSNKMQILFMPFSKLCLGFGQQDSFFFLMIPQLQHLPPPPSQETLWSNVAELHGPLSCFNNTHSDLHSSWRSSSSQRSCVPPPPTAPPLWQALNTNSYLAKTQRSKSAKFGCIASSVLLACLCLSVLSSLPSVWLSDSVRLMLPPVSYKSPPSSSSVLLPEQLLSQPSFRLWVVALVWNLSSYSLRVWTVVSRLDLVFCDCARIFIFAFLECFSKTSMVLNLSKKGNGSHRFASNERRRRSSRQSCYFTQMHKMKW